MNVSCIVNGIVGTRSEIGGILRKGSDPPLGGRISVGLPIVGNIEPLLLSLIKRGSYELPWRISNLWSVVWLPSESAE
jgi:hypothetical protein